MLFFFFCTALHPIHFFYLHVVRQRPPVGKLRVVVAEGISLAARNFKGIGYILTILFPIRFVCNL